MRSFLFTIWLVASIATPAFAFDSLDGDRTGWRGDPSYNIPNAPPEIGLATHRRAVRAAFAAWDAVAGADIDFEEVNDNGDIPVQYLGNWPREFGEFAAGITNTARRGGRIVSARISLNGQHFDWSTDGTVGTSDVQGVITHEVGHAIGLGHSFYREATMYWTGDAGDDLSMRTLAPDDVRGIRFLYGAGGEGRVCDTCIDDDDCAAGGICLNLEPNRSFCGEPCQNGRCPDNAACFELRSGGTQCAPIARVCSDEGVGEFADGDYCFGSNQCGEGRMCYPTADSAQCASTCTPGRGECARGRCVPLGGDEIAGLCLVGGDIPFGEACEDHTDCATTLCLPIDEETSLCSDTCTPAADDCPAGICIETMDPTLPAVCIPPGEGPFGAACDSNLDCASTMCVPLNDDEAVCSRACDPALERCPGGRCFETGDADPAGICIPLGDAAYGDACDSDLVCNTGLCLPLTDQVAVCSQACPGGDADCPGGRCVETGSADFPAVCLPPGDVDEGGRCGTVDRRCADGLACIGDTGAEACRAECAPFGNCPAGSSCSPFAADFWLCLPDDGPGIGASCEEVCAGGLLCLPMGDDEPNLCVLPCFPGSDDCGRALCFELADDLGICPTGETDFGGACEGHLDCLSALCVPGTDGGVCSRGCANDAACGAGWRCEETQSRGRVCFPEDSAGGEGGSSGGPDIGDLPSFGGSSGSGGREPPAGAGGSSIDPGLGMAGSMGSGGSGTSNTGGAAGDGPVPTPVNSGSPAEPGGCDAGLGHPGDRLTWWLLFLLAGGFRIRRMNVRLTPASSQEED